MATETRRSILVVDDSEDTRLSYRTILELAGWSVEEAANGDDAVRLAQGNPPAVAIIDISIPGLDGWQTTRALKQQPATRQVVVIAVTGHALDEDREHARAAGCDSYLIKPIQAKQLLAEIERLTEQG